MSNSAVLSALQRIEALLLDLKRSVAEVNDRLDEMETREDIREAIAMGDTPPADSIPLEEVKAQLLAARQERS
jgi:hypothetical protein